MTRFAVWALLLASLLVLGAGCARSPETGATSSVVNRLTVTFSVDGNINDNYYYFVAFDDNGNPADGPLPVVTSPFGNGWGTGSFSRYVEYHAGQFGVFQHKVNADGTYTDTFEGPPFEYQLPQGGKSISFTLDYLKEFPTDPSTLDINIITTDEIIVDPNLNIVKIFDALGPTGNDYITIPTHTNNTFNNHDAATPEQAGDVSLPALDIVDWKIDIIRG